MRGCRCAREEAVLTAALDRRPEDVPAELVAHLEACGSCRELHTLVSVLQDDRAVALAEARVPSAGQAWWRAELRARQEAAVMAARPITVATGIAAASLIGVLVSLTGALAWWLQDWASTGVVVGAVSDALTAGPWGAPTRVGVSLWLCGGALLLATPVVVYVALTEG